MATIELNETIIGEFTRIAGLKELHRQGTVKKWFTETAGGGANVYTLQLNYWHEREHSTMSGKITGWQPGKRRVTSVKPSSAKLDDSTVLYAQRVLHADDNALIAFTSNSTMDQYVLYMLVD